MKVVLFCHSIVSCWNHGNAHFLRGVVRELVRLGHHVVVHEPRDGWSRTNAALDGGDVVLAEAASLLLGADLRVGIEPDGLDHILDGASLVLVHEWNDPHLVAAIGHRRAHGAPFTLLFHDTHHRAASRPRDIDALDLDGYDGVLAFGASLAALHARSGWGNRAFVWHEAADTTLFRPLHAATRHDVIFVGNWGDGERDGELREWLLDPIEHLRLRAVLHGVRYPEHVRAEIVARGIEHGGWLPNHRVPAAFASSRMTVHVPRRWYAGALPGIPTIRVFEALACGIPLISAPWDDVESLFPPDTWLSARDGAEMITFMNGVLHDRDLSAHLATAGPSVIARRHTCAHRVAELMEIVERLGGPRSLADGHPPLHAAGVHPP